MSQRWDRFDTDAYYERFAVRNTTFNSTSVIRKMMPLPILRMPQDIMHMRPGHTGCSKASSDLHSLDRWNTHHRHAKTSAQTTIPLTITSQADWYTEGNHFKNSSTSIAILLCLKNACNHLLCQG